MSATPRRRSEPFLQQLVQFGILVAALGLVLALIGLYPGITGLEPKSGIGVVQILILIGGMPLMILGAMIFVKVGVYPDVRMNFAQGIAVRLCLTGLLFAAAVGMSDVLGYGSNPPGEDTFPILGEYQSGGMVLGFGIACLGILIFAFAGPPPPLPNQKEDWETLEAKRISNQHAAITPDMLSTYPKALAISVRPALPHDAARLLSLLKQLDRETDFMPYEAGERSTSLSEQEALIREVAAHPSSVLMVADYNGHLIAYAYVQGAEFKRSRHTGHLEVGVLQEHGHEGVGTKLLQAVEKWAIEKGLTRLEAHVAQSNTIALAFYLKHHYQQEGVARQAIRVANTYHDTCLMAKLLEG